MGEGEGELGAVTVRSLAGVLFGSVMMGLWRSMALPPKWLMVLEEEEEEEEEEEAWLLVLRHMAVEACDAQKISMPFIFWNMIS